MIYIVSALQMLILITGGSHIRLNGVDEKTSNQASPSGGGRLEGAPSLPWGGIEGGFLPPWGGTEGGFLIGFY